MQHICHTLDLYMNYEVSFVVVTYQYQLQGHWKCYSRHGNKQQTMTSHSKALYCSLKKSLHSIDSK